MLVKFRSKADSDVLMLGEPARIILTALGKDPADTKGIITAQQLPAAIAALKDVALHDKQENPPHYSEEHNPHEGHHAHALEEQQPVVSLAHRIAPLLVLLEQSLKQDMPVTWEH